MLRALLLAALLAIVTLTATVAYQIVARDRQYRALMGRGDAALQRAEIFGAIEAYSGAVALRPDSTLARLRRGEAYQRRGDLESAVRDLRSAAALDPSAIRPLEELGDVLYQMQRFERAAEIYMRCLDLDDRAARVAQKAAAARYRARSLDDALAALTLAQRLGNNTPEASYLLGLILRDKRRTTAAVAAFEKAVSLAPGFIAPREELADLYRSLGRRADELEQLQVLAGLERDDASRHVALALAQARTGYTESAVLTLGNALERTPDEPRLYEAIGHIWLAEAEAGDDGSSLDKALEALARAASGPRATSDALTLYGRALLRNGQLDRARKALQLAMERYPVEPAAFLHYATVAEQRKDYAAAREALINYGALVREEPGFVTRVMHIAALSLRLEDAASAVRWLERAVQTSPTDVRVIALLAEAEFRLGDQDAARATIRQGLQFDPENATLLSLTHRRR
jgi:tetratricopeptide (TPR) repeat protein